MRTIDDGARAWRRSVEVVLADGQLRLDSVEGRRGSHVFSVNAEVNEELGCIHVFVEGCWGESSSQQVMREGGTCDGVGCHG